MNKYAYNSQTMGSFLERCRNSLKMNQMDIANEIGVTISTISKWESGANQPKTEEQVLLANLFGIPVASLMKCVGGDITVGDLYFESFISDLGTTELSEVQNKKRFVNTYTACRQRINYLIKQFLIDGNAIPLDEFERLSKAIRFGAQFDEITFIHKCSDDFSTSNIDLSCVSLETEDGEEVFADFDSSKKIVGMSYDDYLIEKDNFIKELTKEGYSDYLYPISFFVEENGKKAFCRNVAYDTHFCCGKYMNKCDLIQLKYQIKAGLPLSEIRFYCFDPANSISALIEDDYSLLERYLSSMSINNLKEVYKLITKDHILSSQEENAFINAAGQKTMFGDDMLL